MLCLFSINFLNEVMKIALFPGLIVGLLLAKKICRRQILQPGKCYKWVRSSD
ncbi:hypothetical protein HanIR_Chr15g0756761 [Helianthus annuus]|nr:hypothetical protein HanIR_Chr15g0756761 [Helianthus annuus]